MKRHATTNSHTNARHAWTHQDSAQDASATGPSQGQPGLEPQGSIGNRKAQTWTQHETSEIKKKLLAARVARRLMGVAESKVRRVRTLSVRFHGMLKDKPNFHKSGSIHGMKKLYYGQNALLVRCVDHIYNVSDEPKIYFIYAHD